MCVCVFLSCHAGTLTRNSGDQGETLGAPLMCSPQTAEVMSGDVITQFKNANFGAGSVVVSGVGIEHARLVEYVEAHLGEVFVCMYVCM